MTRLMVLGGGRHQVPLIRRAFERGIDVVLVDYLPDAPGRNLAKYPELVDATDAEAALELARSYEVDGVITTGTDMPIRTMALVAESLDLPAYLTAKSARAATDKHTMHECLTAAGVPMASRTVLNHGKATLDRVELPVVVKPADSQGQRGVTSVFAREHLDSAIGRASSASRSGTVLLEQFLEGPEVTANVWVRRGSVEIMLVNDRITFNPPPYVGIAFQHRFPSQAAATQVDRVRDLAQLIANAYGLETGPLYIQMIMTADGPIIVEAAARIGGGHESRLIHHLNSWSTDDALIDIALGLEPAPPPPIPSEAHSLVNFILGSRGVVGPHSSLKMSEHVLEAAWYVRVGDHLSDVTNSMGRIGYFVAKAETADHLIAAAESYYRSLSLPSDDGRNLVIVPDRALLNLP